MSTKFPSANWLEALKTKLNEDKKYGEIAKNWEGDLLFVIEPAGNLKEELVFYLDLWHGTCRDVEYRPEQAKYPNPAFKLSASYDHIAAILTGKLNPMTAMMTNKLRVQGSLAYMMRNVPVVLDFVRCAQENTTEIL